VSEFIENKLKERQEGEPCPYCKAGRFFTTKSFYYCSSQNLSNGRPGNVCFFEYFKKKIKPAQAAKLLHGEEFEMDGLISAKTGNAFRAKVSLADEGKLILNFK